MMKQAEKRALVAAFILILTGCVLFGGVMSLLRWDFTKLSTAQYETNTYEITEVFTDLSIATDTADVVFLSSDDGVCRVECYENPDFKTSVYVADGALVIEPIETKKWYQRIGINFEMPKITVYLPQAEYGALSVKLTTGDLEIPEDLTFASADIAASTGDVSLSASVGQDIRIRITTGNARLEGLSCASLDLSLTTGDVALSGLAASGDLTLTVTTGDVTLAAVTCRHFTSDGSTGDLILDNVIASAKLSVTRTTGDVTFTKSDAAEIAIKTTTGDVKGSLLSDKIFFPKTTTGSYEVPQTTAGGKCEISTTTGDIRITVCEE